MSLISRYNKLKEEKPSTAIAILLGIGLAAYLILQFIQTQISEEHQVLKEMIKKIAEIQINRVRKRLTDRELKLEITDAAMNDLADHGFDPVFGARPLKRAIQQYIENPLATYLLEGKYTSGDVIKVSIENDSFVFSK